MKETINICFATDNNYAKYMGLALMSILKSANKEDKLHFFILDNQIKQEEKDKIATLKKIKDFLKNPIFRAVGEIGLDYAWLNSSTEKQQQDVFEEMLEISKEVNKPVVLHCRKTNEPDDFKAYEDLFGIMKNHDTQGGIFHCFSARYEDAKRALDRGFLLGLNGVISYKKNNDLRDVIKKIGIEHFALETDCPYLPPQTKRGQRNTPQNIPEIAEYLANLLNISIETCA